MARPRAGEGVGTIGALEADRRKRDAAIALAQRLTVAEAAEAAGVKEATVRGWLRDRTFVARVDQAGELVVPEAVAQMKLASLDAVRTLLEVCRSSKSDTARVSAADKILTRVLPSADSDGLAIDDVVSLMESVIGLLATSEDAKRDATDKVVRYLHERRSG